MAFTRQTFRAENDLPRLSGLVGAMPLACRHVIDLPWRLCSPAIHAGGDAMLWVNADEQVVAFAAWQLYWATLDFFLLPSLPDAAAQTLAADLFAWADGRFRERDAERGRPLPYSVEFRDDDHERRRLIITHGFTLDEQAHYVALEHPLGEIAPIPEPPEGFTLRPLRGAEEAAACAELHRAAFNSDAMTAEWRARVTRAPQYRPDLDLVIAAPDGTLAAYCLGWYDGVRRVAQVEPLGVHPRYQRLGLAHTLLLALLHRFRALGAECALVETDLDRTAARRAYDAAGFRETGVIMRLEKMAPGAPEGSEP